MSEEEKQKEQQKEQQLEDYQILVITFLNGAKLSLPKAVKMRTQQIQTLNEVGILNPGLNHRVFLLVRLPVSGSKEEDAGGNCVLTLLPTGWETSEIMLAGMDIIVGPNGPLRIHKKEKDALVETPGKFSSPASEGEKKSVSTTKHNRVLTIVLSQRAYDEKKAYFINECLRLLKQAGTLTSGDSGYYVEAMDEATGQPLIIIFREDDKTRPRQGKDLESVSYNPRKIVARLIFEEEE